ncbi:MAG TPA: peptidylprolyl isomerase, partial [Pyrinomonadaceae bacterium]
SEDEVKAFYGEAGNEAKFKTFIDKKIEQAKEDGRIPKDREPTEEQLASAKDFYAKARIYEKEADAKKGELGDDYNRKVQLQVKLQQAQYLARLYADRILKDKIRVSEAEVQSYIAEHPELNKSKQKTKAYKILLRAKSGENFAKLAGEFSDDPGSKENGGLYVNVEKGQFVSEFENAALSLKVGQIAPNLIETKYGFHIIKLERKGVKTFDVRHILISTMLADPNNPQMPPVSAEDKVRTKLEEEKEKKAMDELLVSNPIQTPADFAVPELSAEQIKKMQQTQPPKVKIGKKPAVKRKRKN